jgi:hypothetical protein
MAENQAKSKFEIIVDLIKALLWPIIAVFILILFWQPLRLVANQLPSIVSRSETITISGLSLKIRNNDIVQKPSDSVKNVLALLSADGIKRMLNNSTASYWDKGDETFGRSEYEELVKLGLYTEDSAEELAERNKQQKNYGYGVEITSLGKETNNFLVQIVAGFVQELKGTKVN